jgi:redox-sensitive bicupin YhaK (pirin superfamily)
MITIRPSAQRGHFNHGWLDTYHTFAFADYQDPEHMGFRSLRVINEDRVAPGGGFGMHPHRDMEIITYVLSGQLEHRDSLGNGSVIAAGDLQRMSAGTGIRHSEFNPSASEPVHLLQIWIFPDQKGIEPEYEQRLASEFAVDDRTGLRLAASRDGRNNSFKIHQDADLHIGRLAAGESTNFTLRPGRGAWLQVTRGDIELNGANLHAGDGAAVEEERSLTITSTSDSEFLLFDLASR